MSKEVSIIMVGGYLSSYEQSAIHARLVLALPDRISLADKIGIAAMVIDEVNGIIDRMADERADAEETSYAQETTAP